MASSLGERIPQWLAGRYYTFLERCSRRRAFRLLYVVLPLCVFAYGLWLLLEYSVRPYDALWLEFWIISLTLSLAFYVLRYYARLETRRSVAATTFLWLLGVVFFILVAAVKALTRWPNRRPSPKGRDGL